MLELAIQNLRISAAYYELKIVRAAKLQYSRTAHVEFALNKRDSQLVRPC